MVKKINLSKLQFANTFNFTKKTNNNLQKRHFKKIISIERNVKNTEKKFRKKKYLNTSTNIDYKTTEERDFSHEIKKNENFKNKILMKKNNFSERSNK